MSRRVLVVSLSAGLVWGCVAVVVYLAMFRGLVPTPRDLPFPLNVQLMILMLPFYASVGLEVLAARSTYGLGELASGTVASGAVLAVVLGVVGHAVRRVLSGG